MKFMKKSRTRISSALVATFFPFIAFAQVTNPQSLFTYVMGILNGIVVPVIFAIAFVMFIFGVYSYFIQGGADEEKVKEGQRFVMWGVIGFALMFSIWGLINLLINSLSLDNTSRPALPTFGVSGSSLSGGSVGTFPTGTTVNSALPSSLTSVGQSVTGSNGYTYTALQASNGTCPNGGIYNGSVCVIQTQPGTPNTIQSVIQNLFGGGKNTNSTNQSGNAAISGIPKGGSCSTANGSDGQCEGALICSNGTCQTDPQLENGDGTLNSACVPPGDCDGNMVCDVNSDTCQNPNSPGVSDGSGATSNGDGTVGSSCVPPGDCDGDMICDTNSDTCEEPSTANANDGSYTYCSDGSAVPAGSTCQLCPDGTTTTADTSLCPVAASSYGADTGSNEDTGGYTGAAGQDQSGEDGTDCADQGTC